MHPVNTYLAIAVALCIRCSSEKAEVVDAASTDALAMADQASVPDLSCGGETNLCDASSVPDAFSEEIGDTAGAELADRQADDTMELTGVFTVSVGESCPANGSDCFGYATAANWRGLDSSEPSIAVLTSGPCSFIRPATPAYCDPACEPGTVCDTADGTCKPYIAPSSAGTIEISGLKSACTVVPETQYYYYNPQFDPEPTNGELFDEGSQITAVAPGQEVPAFQISGQGVANVTTTLACPLNLTAGEALRVSWTPASLGKVAFYLGSGNHGSQFSRIVCEADDDNGEFLIDGALVQALLEDGVPIWRWTLSREAQTSTVAGNYEIVLSIYAGTSCMW